MSAELAQLKKIVEGAVLASSKPITYEKIIGLFDEDAKPAKSDLVEAFESLKEDYQERGIELQEVASGLRFQVSQDVTTWVGRLQEERPQKYSRALLETIAIIAYRQPVTRGGIEEVRGVAVSSQIIRTLQEREWVRVVGHLDVPGRPALYATTKQFLDYFNLKNLNELPPLSEIKDLEQLNRELDLDEDTAQALQEMVEKEQQEKEAQAAAEATGETADSEDEGQVEGVEAELGEQADLEASDEEQEDGHIDESAFEDDPELQNADDIDEDLEKASERVLAEESPFEDEDTQH